MNYYSHRLLINPTEKTFNMMTHSLWRPGPTLDIAQHTTGEQVYHYSDGKIQLQVFVSAELPCANVIKKFFSYSQVEEYLPLNLIAGSALQYQLELHLLPQSSFKFKQISRLEHPTLKFFQPFACREPISGKDMMEQTLVSVYHEMGHLEATAAWPGGWTHSGKFWWWRHRLDLLVQEIIAGEYEICAQLLMPMVDGMKLSPSAVWRQGEAAAVKAIIKEQMRYAGDLSDVGREIGKYLLAQQINQLADTKDPKQYNHILNYCQQVTTAEHISQRLLQFAPYRALL